MNYDRLMGQSSSEEIEVPPVPELEGVASTLYARILLRGGLDQKQ